MSCNTKCDGSSSSSSSGSGTSLRSKCSSNISSSAILVAEIADVSVIVVFRILKVLVV